MKKHPRLARLALLATSATFAAACSVQTAEDTGSSGAALSGPQGGAHAVATSSPTADNIIAGGGGGGGCAHDVLDQGRGLTLSNPIIVNLFMGQYWETTQGQSDMAAVNAAWQALAPQSELYQPVSEYVNAGVGSYWGSDWVGFGADEGQNGQVNQVQESLIQSFLDFELEQHRAPAPSYTRTIYFVYIGAGAYSQYDTTNSFNAHHHWYASQQAGQTLHYAVVDYESQLSLYTQLAYHELMETITDPEGNAWYDSSLGEGEIGDFCEFGAPYAQGKYNLQQIWSQKACACISPPQPPIYIPSPIHFPIHFGG